MVKTPVGSLSQFAVAIASQVEPALRSKLLTPKGGSAGSGKRRK